MFEYSKKEYRVFKQTFYVPKITNNFILSYKVGLLADTLILLSVFIQTSEFEES